ncbi:MAG: alpha-1,4-glucan--maltose-1-phosphate maltosyltransferase [Janthinobacterium lividum]
MKPNEGRSRVIIEDVKPEVDGGRHAAKRVIGDTVRVTAAIYTDGHDHVAARLQYRRADEKVWRYAPFRELGNDVWEAEFVADTIGGWSYTVQAWVDHFGTWVHELHKRIDAQEVPGVQTAAAVAVPGGAERNDGVAAADENTVAQQDLPGSSGKSANSFVSSAVPQNDIALALRTGAILLDQASARSRDAHAKSLKGAASSLRYMAEKNSNYYEFPLSEDSILLCLEYPDLNFATVYDRELPLWVDRKRAEFSSWYEFFPRSAGFVAGQHGTLRDVAARLPEVARMGFNVVYLPPIHPIGTAFRKGKNNSVTAEPGDVGSPWAIGNSDGGHKAILRELGTFTDFAAMMEAAAANKVEIALDIAFQCAPEHPWVRDHPDWFKIRPDGTIQYAENPPKKYQDIYPINFESSDWRPLWQELYSVFAFWIDKGVRIFRVDNPHTKALPFWEWCIAEVRKVNPDVIFLAEAFTRPHVMYGLAKAGYTQSYTYFSWRTEKQELTEYMTEITTEPVSDFFRGNLWPNTPDILPGFLQTENRAAFAQRAILAATLGANYGVYGPAFELGEHLPAKPGGEEYLDSEKYQLRTWDRDAPQSLAPLLTVLNKARHAHPALQKNKSLRFHTIDNDHLIAYSKNEGDDVVLTIVNLDPLQMQTGWTSLDLATLNLPAYGEYSAEDLLSGETFPWSGARNYVALDPKKSPAHILILRRTPLSDNLAGESTED